MMFIIPNDIQMPNMTKEEYENLVTGLVDFWSKNARKAAGLGYTCMHYTLDKNDSPRYIDGELFEAFAKEDEDRTEVDWNRIFIYAAIIACEFEVVEDLKED